MKKSKMGNNKSNQQKKGGAAKSPSTSPPPPPREIEEQKPAEKFSFDSPKDLLRKEVNMGGHVRGLRFSTSGKMIACAMETGNTKVYNVVLDAKSPSNLSNIQFDEIATVESETHGNSLQLPVAWSHDDKFLATGSKGGTHNIVVYSVALEFKEVARIDHHTKTLCTLQFHPLDHSLLVSGGYDNHAAVFLLLFQPGESDAESEEKLELTLKHKLPDKQTVTSAVFVPTEGKTTLHGGYRGVLIEHSVEDGKLLREIDIGSWLYDIQVTRKATTQMVLCGTFHKYFAVADYEAGKVLSKHTMPSHALCSAYSKENELGAIVLSDYNGVSTRFAKIDEKTGEMTRLGNEDFTDNSSIATYGMDSSPNRSAGCFFVVGSDCDKLRVFVNPVSLGKWTRRKVVFLLSEKGAKNNRICQVLRSDWSVKVLVSLYLPFVG